MLGTLPPLRGISAYCAELVKALAETDAVNIEFISFRSLYPKMLYPGGNDEDTTMEMVAPEWVKHRRRIRWYNPLTWVCEGVGVKADVLHVQWWSWFLAPIFVTIAILFKLRGIPIVATIHNVLPHERGWYKRWLHASIFRLPDHFIVHSEANVRQLQAEYGIAQDRISIIPHGNIPLGTPTATGRQRIRKQFCFSEEDPVILAFGAIRPYKGLDVLLEAFATISSRLANARLMVVGKSWESWEPYRNQIRRLGISDKVGLHIDYVPTTEVADYFLAADLVVLPYRQFTSQTGIGAVALPFGKPLIVSDVGGLPDLVKNVDCIVPPDDPAALAKAILIALEEPERLRALGEDSKQLASEFQWGPISEKLLDVYRHILSPRTAKQPQDTRPQKTRFRDKTTKREPQQSLIHGHE